MKIIALILCFLISCSQCYAASKSIDLIINKSNFIEENDEQEITSFAKALGKTIKEKWYPRDYSSKQKHPRKFDLEYVFQYKNTKTNFSFLNFLRLSGRLLAGLAADRMGLNEVVLIRL